MACMPSTTTLPSVDTTIAPRAVLPSTPVTFTSTSGIRTVTLPSSVVPSTPVTLTFASALTVAVPS